MVDAAAAILHQNAHHTPAYLQVERRQSDEAIIYGDDHHFQHPPIVSNL